jgi:hypothetical protein
MMKPKDRLTPYNINLLQRIQQSSTLMQITCWYGNRLVYDLEGMENGKPIHERIKCDVGYDWHKILKAFFTKTYSDGTSFYKLRSDAEISTEWMLAELQRQADAKASAEEIRAAEIEVEHQASIAYLNEGTVGSPFSAELSGAWGFGGSIFFDGEEIARISPARYSTNDKTFSDLLKYSENIELFKRINRMIVAANKGVV